MDAAGRPEPIPGPSTFTLVKASRIGLTAEASVDDIVRNYIGDDSAAGSAAGPWLLRACIQYVDTRYTVWKASSVLGDASKQGECNDRLFAGRGRHDA